MPAVSDAAAKVPRVFRQLPPSMVAEVHALLAAGWKHQRSLWRCWAWPKRIGVEASP